MHVKDLALEAGVTSHVVRYYTRIGLLMPTRDPSNGYRVHKPNDVHRLKFIRRARWLGFTLSDVRAIFGDVEHKIRYLSRIRKRLKEAQQLWNTMPDRPPNHTSLCHLIDSIAENSGA